MTEERAKKMLKAKLECLKRETSGTDIDCNYRNCDECNLCYEQGNVGEQKEALELAIKALEQESVLDKIRAKIENHCGLAKENHCRYCSYCNNLMGVREILEIIDEYKAESEE